MTPLAYVALIREAEPGAFLVTFPDVPEAISQGDTLAEAEANASDALGAALEAYLDLGRELPARAEITRESVRGGSHWAEIPVEPAIAARAMLTHAMRAQGMSKVGLAAKLGRDEKIVRRILSGKGASLDLTLGALRAIGVRVGLAA